MFIEQNEAALLSSKASPDDIIKSVIRNESIVKFFLVVQSHLSLKSYNCHFLAFHQHELSFKRLWAHFHFVSSGHEFEGWIREGVMTDCLVCSNYNEVWETKTGTNYSGVIFYSFWGLIQIIIEIDADISFSANANDDISLCYLAIS